MVKYEDNGIIAAGNTFGIIAIEDVERKLFFDGGLVARVQVEDIIIVGGTTGMPGDDVHRCVSRVIHRRAIGRGQCSVLRVYVVKHVGTAGDEVVGQRAAGGEHEDAHCVALCPCGIAIGVEGCAGGRWRATGIRMRRQSGGLHHGGKCYGGATVGVVVPQFFPATRCQHQCRKRRE